MTKGNHMHSGFIIGLAKLTVYLLGNYCYFIKDKNLSKSDSFNRFRTFCLVGLSVGHLEPKIWQNEKWMLKYPESIIEIVKTIADVGDKSVNRRSTSPYTFT